MDARMNTEGAKIKLLGHHLEKTTIQDSVSIKAAS